MLKALHHLFLYGLDLVHGRRLAGRNRASKTPAKHADGTKFHCSRKLIAPGRADALGLRFHGPNRPSAAFRSKSNTALPRVVRKRPPQAPSKLLSRCTNKCVFLYTSASNHVSVQNSNRWCAAASRVDNELRRWAIRITAVNLRLSTRRILSGGTLFFGHS